MTNKVFHLLDGDPLTGLLRMSLYTVPITRRSRQQLMKTFKSLISMICLALALTASAEANPLKRFNFSVWTDYSGMKFDGLSQEEKTDKLQKLFKDKVKFAETYNARRVLVKILNPAEFDFFNTEKYDATRDDNFYYWALQLTQHAEIEAVFDIEAFDIGTQSWTDRILGYAATWLRIERPLGEFRNLKQKLAWVSFLNEMSDPSGKVKHLVRGITIDPKNLEEESLQLIINILDQYKYNASEELPKNPYSDVRMAVYLSLDQKNMALCNLGRFPLQTDMRGQRPGDIGVIPPVNFPSEGPSYLAPEWRSDVNHPLLDAVYLKMADNRLVESIYQNHSVLPDPAEHNQSAVRDLVLSLGRNFRGVPFVKGPGKISNIKGTSEVSGLYTFFRTGGGKYMQGQVIEGGAIEVRPPHVSKEIRKIIATQPESNKHLKLTSTFSTTENVEKAEYYVTATPISWITPSVSNCLRTKIYYVFSTGFDSNEGRFFGNWSLENFLDFLSFSHKNQRNSFGFLMQPVFKNLRGEWEAPVNNIVLHDFTTIPNGTPFPECDWGLGNQNHY